MPPNDYVIVAPATPPGTSAIALVRVSGKEAITMVQGLFDGKNLAEVPSHTVHLGPIHDEQGVIDEVMVTVFREPRSFTRENAVEISCHGSPLIVQRIIRTMLNRGAVMAAPGEFTKRAFLNGRFDPNGPGFCFAR